MNFIKKYWSGIVIAIILAVFAGVVYYGNIIKPSQEVDKEAGYAVGEYITLGDYKGVKLEITQEQFDETVNEETESYEVVERAVKEGDAIEVTYKGYIDGKKDKNISESNCELYVGQEQDMYAEFANALIGKKAGTTVEVKSSDATFLSEDGTDYAGKEATFKVKLVSVSEKVQDEVTDEWVLEYYFDDYALETAKDFYEWNEEYLLNNSKSELWQKVVDNADMNGYPQELYESVKEEFDADTAYYAEMFGMDAEEYLSSFYGYDDEGLEKEYLNQVKSELVMWAIVKAERIEVSDADVEEKYEELYEEYEYESVDDMKVDYSETEIKEAVYLDKAIDFVFDNCDLVKGYKFPTE